MTIYKKEIELSVDDLPEEMVNDIARDVINYSSLYISLNGKEIDIHHESLNDHLKDCPKFNILELIKEYEGYVDDYQPLIKTLEDAVKLLKEFDAK